MLYKCALGGCKTLFRMVCFQFRKILRCLWFFKYVSHFCLVGFLFCCHSHSRGGSRFFIGEGENTKATYPSLKKRDYILQFHEDGEFPGLVDWITEEDEAELPFFRRRYICYEPSGSDTSKKRGFDFHIFTWDT